MKNLHLVRGRFIEGAILILGLALWSNPVFAQAEVQEKPDDNASGVYAQAYSYESDQKGKGRVEIDIQIPYENVSFVKEDDLYVARLEIAASISSPEDQPVWQKSQSVEIRVKEFAQTTSSRHSSFKQFSTDLSPGKYELLLQVTDEESKKGAKIERPLKVVDFGSDSLAVSDLMLVSRVSSDGAKKAVVPNLIDNVEQDTSGFYLFFEIYDNVQIDSVRLSCKFFDARHELALERTKLEVLDGNRTQVVWKIDTPSLSAGHYLISLEAEGALKNQPSVVMRNSASRSFFIRIHGLPLTITDIDKAIDQLRYIATGSEIDNIKEAPNPLEKQKRFLEFWAKRNPGGSSTHNALMEEYYARVAYANRNFTRYQEGWKTDMGMIFIEFGPPQNIERHPFESDSKPYEIWYYYDQNRQFIFVDDSGFGDYHLQYPTTDLWGRIR
jgi:GWxTD domain-containing protein